MSKSKILVVAALYKEIHTVNCPRGLITGIGKTNAALKLSKYLGENPEVERVINFGTACGINYKIGDVIECTEFINGGFSYPGIDNSPDDKIIQTSDYGPSVASFDSFVTEFPQEAWDRAIDCVDMEAYAYAKVCKEFGVEFLCHKYITDSCEEDEQESNWEERVSDGSNLFEIVWENVRKS